METKQTHFKMYKIGRRWAFACATLLVLGGATVTANAAENAESSNSSSSESTAKVTASATSTSSSSQVLKTSAKTNSASQSQMSQSSSASSSDVSSSELSSSASSKQSSQTATPKDSTEGTQVTSAKKVQSASTDNDEQKQQPADTQTTTTTSSSDTQKQVAITSDKSMTTTTATSDANKVTATSTTLPKAANFGAFKSSLKANAAVKANDAVQDGGSVYDDYPDLNNILGISSQFHIFAREAELNAHTNGNLAVQNLIGNVNFGTSIIEELLDKDISYIQNITNIANSSFVSNGATRTNKVIFGEGIEIDVSNPNRPMVNGTYIDHLLAEEVYQDKNGNVYIDFDKEFEKLKTTNQDLSEKAAQASYTNADFPDQNDRVIDVTDLQPDENGRIVINLTADMLTSNTPLIIKGVSPDADGNTIILNVDTEGQADYTVTSQIRVFYPDGSERGNKETEDFGDNHLLWNFFDSTASDKQFTGNLNIDRPFQGSILAPSATVTANANVDGNIIAEKVVVNAETHRWDLQNNKDNEEGPEDPDVTPDPGPEFPEPEEPEPEEPGTEEPEEPEPETPGTEEPEEPEPETPGTEEPTPEEPEEPDTDTDTNEGVEEPEEPTDVDEPEDSDDNNTAVPDEEAPDEDEHLYSEDYDEAVEESFEDALDDALAEPTAEARIEAEKALLTKLDAAIAQAKANGDQILVAKLEALRARLVAIINGGGTGLPQTDESQTHTAAALGLGLAAGTMLLGQATLRRKRRN